MEQMVILWTDALVFMLLVVAIAFGLYASRKEHLRAPWRFVIRSKVGVSTMVVLSFYIAIGLIDPVHFHPKAEEPGPNGEVVYSVEVISLFDDMVSGLRSRQEKTYSAPLATHLYAKENIEDSGPDTLSFHKLFLLQQMDNQFVKLLRNHIITWYKIYS